MLPEAFGCFMHGFFLDNYGEIGPLVDLAHFDDLVVGHRCSLGPFERLFPRTHLDDPIAADSLVGLSERSIRDRGIGCSLMRRICCTDFYHLTIETSDLWQRLVGRD